MFLTRVCQDRICVEINCENKILISWEIIRWNIYDISHLAFKNFAIIFFVGKNAIKILKFLFTFQCERFRIIIKSSKSFQKFSRRLWLLNYIDKEVYLSRGWHLLPQVINIYYALGENFRNEFHVSHILSDILHEFIRKSWWFHNQYQHNLR